MAEKRIDKRKKVDWDELANMVQAGSADFIFTKNPRTRVRLMHSPNDEKPIRPIEVNYQGRQKIKYMILAYSPDDPAPPDHEAGEEDDTPTIKALICTKTVVRDLTTLGKEGYDFFDDEEGYGCVIVRTENPVRYSVLPSKKPQPLPEGLTEELWETSLADMAEAYAQFQENRQQNNEGGKEDKEDW